VELVEEARALLRGFHRRQRATAPAAPAEFQAPEAWASADPIELASASLAAQFGEARLRTARAVREREAARQATYRAEARLREVRAAEAEARQGLEAFSALPEIAKLRASALEALARLEGARTLDIRELEGLARQIAAIPGVRALTMPLPGSRTTGFVEAVLSARLQNQGLADLADLAAKIQGHVAAQLAPAHQEYLRRRDEVRAAFENGIVPEMKEFELALRPALNEAIQVEKEARVLRARVTKATAPAPKKSYRPRVGPHPVRRKKAGGTGQTARPGGPVIVRLELAPPVPVPPSVAKLALELSAKTGPRTRVRVPITITSPGAKSGFRTIMVSEPGKARIEAQQAKREARRRRNGTRTAKVLFGPAHDRAARLTAICSDFEQYLAAVSPPEDLKVVREYASAYRFMATEMRGCHGWASPSLKLQS